MVSSVGGWPSVGIHDEDTEIDQVYRPIQKIGECRPAFLEGQAPRDLGRGVGKQERDVAVGALVLRPVTPKEEFHAKAPRPPRKGETGQKENLVAVLASLGEPFS